MWKWSEAKLGDVIERGQSMSNDHAGMLVLSSLCCVPMHLWRPVQKVRENQMPNNRPENLSTLDLAIQNKAPVKNLDAKLMIKA